MYTSQDKLGFATETNNPKISVAYHILVLFLIHAMCPPYTDYGSTVHSLYSRIQAAIIWNIAGFMQRKHDEPYTVS